jgi:hypothetical protein
MKRCLPSAKLKQSGATKTIVDGAAFSSDDWNIGQQYHLRQRDYKENDAPKIRKHSIRKPFSRLR